jgi:Lar family restriction alleviation protein
MFTEAEHGRAIVSATPLPCPFCGGEPQVYLQIEATSAAPAVYVAGCALCGAEAPGGPSQLGACAAWNTRHNERA